MNRSRVPVGVVAGNKRVSFVFPDRSVLIQIVGRIRKRGARFRSGVSVPDVVESVGIFVVPERRGRKFAPRVVAERVVLQFAPRVVAERVVLRRAVSRRRTRERTPERVADVSALRNERRSPLVRDAREQIPRRLVGARLRHVVRACQRLHKRRSRKIGIREGFLRAAVHEARRRDVSA